MDHLLDAIDRNFFLLDSSSSSQVIASLSVVQGVPNAEALRESIIESVKLFPRARCRLDESDPERPRWIESEQFSVEEHLRFHELRSGCDFSQLLDLASTVFSRGLETDRPLWCFHVISSEGVSRSLVLFLIHHGFSDGGGGMEFVHSVCEPRKRGKTEEERTRNPVASIRQRSTSGADSGAWPKYTRAGGGEFFSSLFRAVRDMRIRRLPFPYHGENSNQRSLKLLTLSQDRARTIKEALGVSLNDVYLSYVAGAVRQLNRLYGLPPGARAFIPFNLRPRQARRNFGNFLSAVPISLPAEEADPVQRTVHIHAETSGLKAEGAYGAFGFLGKVSSFFPRRFRMRLIEAATRRGNFICTNVPSSRQRLVFAGAPVLESYGCAALLPAHGIALGFMSYVDLICISLVCDPKIVRNPDEILRALQSAEEELFDVVTRALRDQDPSFSQKTAEKFVAS